MAGDRPLTTETASHYSDLEKMEVMELLTNINKEDKTVPDAVELALPQIEQLVTRAVGRVKAGGRVFYIGAGTSGRLGILDASEIPPTYGATPDLFIGIIAGGDVAIRSAVEGAEDDMQQGFKDLETYNIGTKDTVIGIAASGTTPYVIGGLKEARKQGLLTACITCNREAPITAEAAIPIVAEVGPEFVTGSTRMKAGTAQKLILNMISSSIMIRLGKVKGNRMVDMQLSNKKLLKRGATMIMDELNVDADVASKLLVRHGSVRKAVEFFRKNTDK